MTTDAVRPALFGDYSLSKARGRWTGACYHCPYRTKGRGYPGHAQTSVREHLRDSHHVSSPRRDARVTWMRDSAP